MFYLSLARELGMTKRQLLSNLDSREITEWIAFFTIIGEKKTEPEQTQAVMEAGLKMGIEDLSRRAKAQKK